MSLFPLYESFCGRHRPLYNLSYSLSCRFDFMRLSVIKIRSRKCNIVHVGTLTYKLERVVCIHASTEINVSLGPNDVSIGAISMYETVSLI